MLPTNTWQAYNFQDVNGDGYGDTWYAGPPNRTVDLGRTYIARGVPPRFYRYDLPFLHWLYWSGKQAEFISDSDFDNITNGDQLAASYDLIVFEGHEEYVRPHEYDVVQRFRDLGGNLMFLSANNFFWKVQKSHNKLAQDRALARRGPPGGRADRRRVPRERRRPAARPLHRAEQRGDPVAVGRHRADRRLDVRPVRRRVRDRDRRRSRRSHRPGRSSWRRSPTCSGRG